MVVRIDTQNTIQHDDTHHNTTTHTQHNTMTTQHDDTQHSMTKHNTTRYDL